GGGDAVGQVLEEPTGGPPGQAETEEEGARRAPHRGDVAGVDRDRLPAQEERRLARPEVLVLHQRVGRQEGRSERRSVVARSEGRRRERAGMTPEERLDEPDLPETSRIHRPPKAGGVPLEEQSIPGGPLQERRAPGRRLAWPAWMPASGRI